MAAQKLLPVSPIYCDEGLIVARSTKRLRDPSIVNLLTHFSIPEDATEVLKKMQYTEQLSQLSSSPDPVLDSYQLTISSEDSSELSDMLTISTQIHSDSVDDCKSKLLHENTDIHTTDTVLYGNQLCNDNNTSVDVANERELPIANESVSTSDIESVKPVTASVNSNVSRPRAKRKVCLAAVFNLANSTEPGQPTKQQSTEQNVHTENTMSVETSRDSELVASATLKSKHLNRESSWTNKKTIKLKIGATPSIGKSPEEEYYQSKSEHQIANIKKQIKKLKESLQDKEENNELVQVDEPRSRTFNMVINSSLKHVTSSFWQAKYNHQIENKIYNMAKYMDRFESLTLRAEEKYLRYLNELYV